MLIHRPPQTHRVMIAAVVAAILSLFAGNASAVSIYVDHNAIGTGTVGDPNDPFPSMRAGIAASTSDADVIYVADGIYDNSVESFTGSGEIILNRSYDIYGGYAGYDAGSSTYDWSTRIARSTVVDLNGTSTRAFNLTGASYKRPLIDGFTFQNANNANDGGAVRMSGGFQAGGFINDCLFQDNISTGDGGAVYMSTSYAGSDVNITNSEFVNNTGRYGGAVYYSPSNQAGTISGNTFTSNTADEAGALHVTGSVFVLQSEFDGNHADVHSGALGSSGSPLTLTVRQSIFDGNSADGNGAVFGVDHGFHPKNIAFENSLITNSSGGVAIYHYGGGGLTIDFSTLADNLDGGIIANTTLTLTNSIVASNGPVGVSSSATSPLIEYTDVWGNTTDYVGNAAAGTGSLSVDPMFYDSANDIFSLLQSSALLTAADPSATLLEDLLGDVRPQNGGRAMGAYETAAVPEPASFGLLLIGLGGLIVRRRR